MMAWDPKGTRIGSLYTARRLKLFVYRPFQNDNITIDQTIRPGAGHEVNRTATPCYSLPVRMDIRISSPFQRIEKPFGRSPMMCMTTWMLLCGIPQQNRYHLFASNRPTAKTRRYRLPAIPRFNIFLITDFGDKAELNQITQLTNQIRQCPIPTQYNMNHFTFVSDENGIGNQYAGFTTEKRDWTCARPHQRRDHGTPRLLRLTAPARV